MGFFDRRAIKKYEKEADKVLKYESKMAAINPGGDQLLNNAQIDGKEAFLARSSSLDLERILDHYQLGSTVNYTGDLTYLDGIDSIFTEDNLSGIKAYFKVCLILNSLQLLDKDTFDQTEILKLDPTNPYATVSVAAPDRYLFKTIRTSPLCGAMEQAYLDRYFDQRVYDDVYGILEELRDGYKEIIEEKDWLSSENKEKVKEKLDAMIFNVMKPSNEADYGDMTFSSYEEGGTLLDAYCKLNCFKIRHYGEITQMDYDRGFWDIYDTKSPTTQVGDQYDGGRNSIVVMIGILEEDIYSYDMTYEEKLGSIGTVLGHEMSHAFDSEGIYQDKNGDYTNLIEEKDLRRFNQKAEKVTEYFSGIQPFEDSDGYPSDNNLSSEAIADMGGMSVALRIADKKTDFDYDLFFRSFSRLWRRLTLKGDQIDSLRNDKHPLAYLRVNITVQQFDKFYETYNIQPGDNMYLPPKERIAIW